ncbi:hypothetical protein CANCADRAFT_31987 [Tortispora caseinolytica NRRL Y-17796]|uniref:CCCH zinc finger and SMR domain-containing protein n=1 Tax=Tortispora caseinolytica NRRL Y-17796 TaxID=767744 RepID=A0A1E4THU6_9ASCO|nr:hypothetical protein CANCADRAFT_31987 [Tortispora caseinolytica NRRL Y-17796]
MPLDDALQSQCLKILNDSSRVEEENLELVEDAVRADLRRSGGPISDQQVEKIVLELLWKHHEESNKAETELEPEIKPVKKTQVAPVESAKLVAKPAATEPISDLHYIEQSLQYWNPYDTTASQYNYGAYADANAYGFDGSESSMYYQPDITEQIPQGDPHDSIRKLYGVTSSNAELDRILEKNQYELLSTANYISSQERTSVGSRPIIVDHKSTICRYFLSSGSCARPDCHFTHDLSTVFCRHWLAGQCFLGNQCEFLHYISDSIIDDVALIMNANRPKSHQLLQTTDPGYVPINLAEFPQLGSTAAKPFDISSMPTLNSTFGDDFPSLSDSLKPAKPPRKPATIAEVVASGLGTSVNKLRIPMSMSAKAGKPGKKACKTNRPNIAAPKDIKHIEAGLGTSAVYLSNRASAIEHGKKRNQYFQQAAKAYNRGDSKEVKRLSTLGRQEDEAMRRAHRLAAENIFDERNKELLHSQSDRFVDLHGLHVNEALIYLEELLTQAEEDKEAERKPIYVITGSGHHSKNQRDKLGTAVKGWLDDWNYNWQEFGLHDTSNSYGGVIGVDPWSHS